ncbi:MAG: c-type cytochrome [Sideroxyarcus sp.]|nr:c-type cytochrome [Sideroxyarcus sp.]
MKKARTGAGLLAVAALLGMTIATAVRAADTAGLVETCFACHGKNGVSTDANVPSIASYSEEYLAGTMKKYQKKDRPCVEAEYHSGSKKGTKTDMCKIAAGLSEGDVKQIGEFFAAQTFVRTPQTFDAELAKQGKAIHNTKCYTCHADDGSLPSDNAGILAGQKIAYLRQQIKFFKEGKRPMSKKMKPKLESLDDAQLEAVVHFYGSLQ